VYCIHAKVALQLIWVEFRDDYLVQKCTPLFSLAQGEGGTHHQITSIESNKEAK